MYYVYLIEQEDTGYVKFGISFDPQSRLIGVLSAVLIAYKFKLQQDD